MNFLTELNEQANKVCTELIAAKRARKAAKTKADAAYHAGREEELEKWHASLENMIEKIIDRREAAERADILRRADNKCEFCGVENYFIKENGSRVVLTIAHLDHTPENCAPDNLRALCQKCHKIRRKAQSRNAQRRTTNEQKRF